MLVFLNIFKTVIDISIFVKVYKTNRITFPCPYPDKQGEVDLMLLYIFYSIEISITVSKIFDK